MLLLRAGWYVVLKILHCRKSRTIQCKEEVKFKFLSSSFFFIRKQHMKMLLKVSISTQRIIGTFSRVSIFNILVLKQDICLYSPIILWEFNYVTIMRFKGSCFVFYLWIRRYFRLCLINRFRIYLDLRFGFKMDQHNL